MHYTKTANDTSLNLIADKVDTYTKTATDLLQGNKLDISTYNTCIALKANTVDIYNKSLLYTTTEIDSFLNFKSDVVDVYTKIATDLLLVNK